VAKFPVLIRLDSSSFNAGFGQAAAGGADLRFTKANTTTRLPHQIESWNAAAKKAAVWVLLDSLKGGGIDSLRMHWGNATAPNLSSGPSVFDTANGFEAVWHMNATAGNEMDATVNGYVATATNGPTDSAGAIGPTRVFNGTDQYFRVVGSAAGRLSFSVLNSYTLSAWANPTVIATNNNGPSSSKRATTSGPSRSTTGPIPNTGKSPQKSTMAARRGCRTPPKPPGFRPTP
jgi:hypothetical protein